MVVRGEKEEINLTGMYELEGMAEFGRLMLLLASMVFGLCSAGIGVTFIEEKRKLSDGGSVALGLLIGFSLGAAYYYGCRWLIEEMNYAEGVSTFVITSCAVAVALSHSMCKEKSK